MANQIKNLIIPLLGIMVMVLVVPLTFSATAESSTVDLTLSFTNLANPGDDHYEGWLIVDGEAIGTGKFTLDSAGKLVDLEGKAIIVLKLRTLI